MKKFLNLLVLLSVVLTGQAQTFYSADATNKEVAKVRAKADSAKALAQQLSSQTIKLHLRPGLKSQNPTDSTNSAANGIGPDFAIVASRTFTDSLITAKLAAFAPSGGGFAAQLTDFLYVGNSLTDVTNGITYRTQMQARFPNSDHKVVARGGASSTQIAAFLGAIPIEVGITGDQIPASGSILVKPTVLDITPSALTITGKLNGVAGTLTRTGTDYTTATYTFARTTAGSAVTLTTGKAQFVADFLYPGRITVVEIGQNDEPNAYLFRYNVNSGTANGAMTGTPIIIQAVTAIKNLVERNGGIAVFTQVNGANKRSSPFPVGGFSASDTYQNFGHEALRRHPQGVDRRMLETVGRNRFIPVYTAMRSLPAPTARDRKDSLYGGVPQSYRWTTDNGVADTNDVHLSVKGVTFKGNYVADFILANNLYKPASTTVSSTTTTAPAGYTVNSGTVWAFNWKTGTAPPTGSGQTVTNAGTGGNGAIANNSGTLAFNTTERAYQVTGNDDFLDLGAKTLSNNYIVGIRIKITQANQGFFQIFGDHEGTGQLRLDADVNGEVRAFVYASNGNNQGSNVAGTLPVNTWAYLAFHRSPTGYRILLNNQVAHSVNFTGTTSASGNSFRLFRNIRAFVQSLTFEDLVVSGNNADTQLTTLYNTSQQ